VLRLDAVPFTWKRMGTDCQNQPEAHWLLQAWRALVRIAAPATMFKAEAIVAPDELVQYLGAHERVRDECELAYHNQLMVMGWSAMAQRDGASRHPRSRAHAPPPPGTGWVTYVRCHDDIGWAVDDADAGRRRARRLQRTARSSTPSTPASIPARSPAGRASR
jgi:amylosucrase